MKETGLERSMGKAESEKAAKLVETVWLSSGNGVWVPKYNANEWILR